MRAFVGASLVTGAMLALMSAGCAQVGAVRAKQAFKSANTAYQTQNYPKAAALYEQVLAADPTLTQAYFYLGNSYDNQYKAAKQGEPANDAFLHKAVDAYQKCAEKLAGSPNEADRKLATLSLQYLVAAYGSDKLNDSAQAEPVLIKMIQLDPGEPSNYAVLAKIYEDAGLYDVAEKVLLMSKDAKPKDAGIYMQLAGFYQRQGEFDKTIDALNHRAEIEPNNPEAFQTIAGYYWDETRSDSSLTDQEKRQYIDKGLDAVNKALSIKADYVEAITFKGLLLRLEANIEKDPSKQQSLLKEATELSDKANDLRKQKTTGTSD
jgi:tetratricopeptide (TPR) repeat protein